MGHGPIVMDEWRQDAARKRARLQLLHVHARTCARALRRGCTMEARLPCVFVLRFLFKREVFICLFVCVCMDVCACVYV